MGRTKKISSEIVADATGRQYHIGCKPGEIAERILLVGDPERADKVASRFEKIRFKTSHREYVTVTGVHKGLEITVLATGIGQDNTEIAVIEASQITKNPILIRAGSCGALQSEPNLGDLIISRAAMKLEGTTAFFVEPGYPAIADSDVTLALGMACEKLGVRFFAGITASTAGFYGAQGRSVPGFPIRFPNLPQDLAKIGVANFEMETATLFTLAQLRGLRAGAVCAVYGSRVHKEFSDAKKRSEAEARCIDTALEAFHLLEKMDAQAKKRKLPYWLPDASSFRS